MRGVEQDWLPLGLDAPHFRRRFPREEIRAGYSPRLCRSEGGGVFYPDFREAQSYSGSVRSRPTPLYLQVRGLREWSTQPYRQAALPAGYERDSGGVSSPIWRKGGSMWSAIA